MADRVREILDRWEKYGKSQMGGVTYEDIAYLLERLKKAEDLLRGVAESGIEHEDPRIDYLTVQIDRPAWDAIRALTETEG